MCKRGRELETKSGKRVMLESFSFCAEAMIDSLLPVPLTPQ